MYLYLHVHVFTLVLRLSLFKCTLLVMYIFFVSSGRQAHVDHHGRTYYMDHNTRTIAYNGGQREGGGGERRREEETGDRGTPERRNPRDMQTRREMLDRRYVLVYWYSIP